MTIQWAVTDVLSDSLLSSLTLLSIMLSMMMMLSRSSIYHMVLLKRLKPFKSLGRVNFKFKLALRNFRTLVRHIRPPGAAV